MKLFANEILDRPSFPERYEFLEKLRTTLNHALTHPKGPKINKNTLVSGKQTAIDHAFSGENFMLKTTFDFVVKGITKYCTWESIEDDIENLEDLFSAYETAAREPKNRRSENLKHRILEHNTSHPSAKFDSILKGSGKTYADLTHRETVEEIVHTSVTELRVSGQDALTIAQTAACLANGLAAHLEGLNTLPGYISWAIATALDAGSYAAFHGLNVTALMHFNQLYEKFGRRDPVFQISHAQNRHRLASAIQRNRVGASTEHDVYQLGVYAAGDAYEIAASSQKDTYVKWSEARSECWKGNSALEFLFHGADLDCRSGKFGKETNENGLLSSIKEDETNENFESAARFCSSLGREYLRRNNIDRAREMAAQARGNLMKLIPEQERGIMQASYALPIIMNRNPTAWAGWMVLNARTSFALKEMSREEEPMNIFQCLSDGATLYDMAGATSLAKSALLTRNRVAEHFGSATRI